MEQCSYKVPGPATCRESSNDKLFYDRFNWAAEWYLGHDYAFDGSDEDLLSADDMKPGATVWMCQVN